MLTETLEDPRPQEPVPIVFYGMVEQAKYLKFAVEEYYGPGPALQFIDVESHYYEASYALELANCDHYTFSTDGGFK